MPSAIVRAFDVVDHHARREAAAAATRTRASATAATTSAAAAAPTTTTTTTTVTGETLHEAAYAHSEALPRTLPYFRVCARAGPSPYDAHRGTARRTARALWEASVDFDLVDDGDERTVRARAAADDHDDDEVTATRMGKAARVCAAAAAANATMHDDVYCRIVAHEHFHTVTLPMLVALSREQPQHEQQQHEQRAAMPQSSHDADRAAQRQLLRTLRLRKAKLYAACVQQHPHGALGLVDSPYGDDKCGGDDDNDDDVYGAHAVQLRRCDARARQQHRRHYYGEQRVLGTCDSMHGAVPLREDVAVHGPRACAPLDNLFGAVLLPAVHTRQQQQQQPQ